LLDDIVAFLALDIGNKSNAARIMFVRAIVKTLGFRQIRV
jgi:hypothetical protein